VVGFVEPQTGKSIDEDELVSFLRLRLAPYKIPGRWFVMERLPATTTGKLLKPALRPLLADTNCNKDAQ
jgi:acyl-coenzyme A synthetase/AMP-(fatty) acid ligase